MLATTVSWISAVTGNWFTSPQWSSPQPPNGVGTDVVIAAPGAPYSVLVFGTVNDPRVLTLDSLTIGSPNSGLFLGSFSSLSLTSPAGPINVNAGTLELFSTTIANARIATTGVGTTVFNSVTLDAVTIAGRGMTGDSLSIKNNLVIEAGAELRGFTHASFLPGHQTVSGGGRIFMSQNSEIQVTGLTLGPDITVSGCGTIFAPGAGSIVLQGTLAADNEFQALGVTGGVGSTFTNQGRVEARGRLMRFADSDLNITNFNNGTLTGGTWVALGGGTVELNQGAITTNAATLQLSGAGSSLPELQLQNNIGTLLVTGGARLSSGSLINSGTIQASGGGSLLLGGSFQNSGTVTVDSSGVLSVGPLNNLGKIVIDGGALEVTDPNLQPGDLTISNGTVQLGGGSVTLANLQPLIDIATGSTRLDVAGGTLNLLGQTLPVVQDDYTLRVAGGTIGNGTITGGSATPLSVVRGTNGRLQNVTLQADLNVSNGATITLANTSFAGRTITLNGDGTRTTLLGDGTIGAAGSSTIILSAGANHNILGSIAGGSATIDQSITVRAQGGGTLGTPTGVPGVPNGTLTNRGRIVCEMTTGQLYSIGTFTNAGAIDVQPGAALVLNGGLGGRWSNANGSINVNNGSVLMLGTFSGGDLGTINRTGGTITLTGVMENAGHTLVTTSATGPLEMTYLRIDSGTLNAAADAPLVVRSTSPTVDSAATFNGASNSGHVIIQNDSLRLEGEVHNSGVIVNNFFLRQIDGTFTNSGAIHTAASTGFQTGGEFIVTPTGLIDGTGQFTQTSGTSQIDGTFEIGSMTVQFGTITTNGAVDVANGLIIQSNGNVRFSGGTLHAGSIAMSGKLTQTAGSNRAVKTGALLLVSNGRLDVTDNGLIVGTGTSKSVVEGYIRAARNFGAWDKPGLTSSSAAAHPHHVTTLGVLSGGEFTSVGGSGIFHQESYLTSDTLIEYTYYGDTDFNGLVDFDDYARIDAGFNNNRTGWFNGDVDLNGIIDFDDYSLIDLAFNTQSGTLRRAVSYLDGSSRSNDGMNTPALLMIQQHFAQFGNVYASSFLNSVPEPASVGAMGLGLFLLPRRRIRRGMVGHPRLSA